MTTGYSRFRRRSRMSAPAGRRPDAWHPVGVGPVSRVLKEPRRYCQRHTQRQRRDAEHCRRAGGRQNHCEPCGWVGDGAVTMTGNGLLPRHDCRGRVPVGWVRRSVTSSISVSLSACCLQTGVSTGEMVPAAMMYTTRRVNRCRLPARGVHPGPGDPAEARRQCLLLQKYSALLARPLLPPERCRDFPPHRNGYGIARLGKASVSFGPCHGCRLPEPEACIGLAAEQWAQSNMRIPWAQPDRGVDNRSILRATTTALEALTARKPHERRCRLVPAIPVSESQAVQPMHVVAVDHAPGLSTQCWLPWRHCVVFWQCP